MDQIVRMIDSASSTDVTYLLLCVICSVLILTMLARFLARAHATLEGIKRGIEDASEQEREALDNLQKAVSGESENSLLSQVRKLQTNFVTHKDSQHELIRELRQFAQTMAESNSKILIESFENVIRDFNAQLNEQFGESFKQLSQVVGALTVPAPARLAPPEPVPSPTPKPVATPEQEPAPELELGAVWAKECCRVDNHFRDAPHAKALFSGSRIDISNGLSGAKAHARENHVVVIYSRPRPSRNRNRHPSEDQRPARWYVVIGMDGEAVSTHAVLDNDRGAWDALADVVRDAIVSDGDKVKSTSKPTPMPDSTPAPTAASDAEAAELTRQENHGGETFDDRRHPPPDHDTKVVFDAERVASVMADTERASSVLEGIFGEEEPENERKETLEDTGGVFSGLDAQHAAFLGELLTQLHWEEAELATLTGQFRLMQAGALETVNEWSFEHFGDSLIIEEHKRYSLDPEITAQLRE